MDPLEKELQPFLKDPEFVYKSCQIEWLVVLQKILETTDSEGPYTETNEERVVYDSNYSQYRGSGFKVVAIINKFDPTKKINSIRSSQYSPVFYTVGKIVKSNGFDSDPTVVNGKGISYFKTPEPAYYYELNTRNSPKKTLKGWYENGRCEFIINYKDDEQIYEFTFWYKNGQPFEKCYFKDEQREDKYTSWHENGQQKDEWHYINGKQDGEYISWYENGQFEVKANFKNGKLDGEYTCWHQNGILLEHCYYENDKLYGIYTSWYKNGQLKEKCHYKDGERDGEYQKWNENGKLEKKSIYKKGKTE